MNNTTIKKLVESVVKFRDDRDWKKFHNPKDLAIAMQLEVAEIFDHLKWQTNEEFSEYFKKHKREVKEEVIDVLYHVLLFIHEFNIDLDKDFFAKMKKNEKKYPISLYKGKNSFQVKR